MRAALGRDGVELVEEDDAGPRVARALEDAPYVRLGLADVHVEQFGALDGEEVERARRSDCFGEQCLASARRPIEQNTWRVSLEQVITHNGIFSRTGAFLEIRREKLRVLQWQLDGI